MVTGHFTDVENELINIVMAVDPVMPSRKPMMPPMHESKTDSTRN